MNVGNHDTEHEEIPFFRLDQRDPFLDIDASLYKGDIKLSASDYMESFFRDKCLACGGPIPRGILFSEENISLVVNTRMTDGIDKFYEVFYQEFDVEECPQDRLSPDISFLRVIHRECAERNIPKQYASGISILYLRLCAKLPRKEMRKSA